MTSLELDERAAKSKFVAQSGPALYYLQQQVEQAKKLETSDKLRVFVLNMSSLSSVKAAIYEIRVLFLVLRRRWNTVQDIHFVL